MQTVTRLTRRQTQPHNGAPQNAVFAFRILHFALQSSCLMDRRSFIKLTAISGTSAALASCGNPENEIIRFVPDEDIMPGIATMKPSVCTLCAAGCGLTVRMMMADADVVRNGQAGLVRIHAAKKLEGIADHPVNHGGLCARGQAAIQVTYHPDRITQPLRRSGNRGQGQIRRDFLGRRHRGTGVAPRQARRRQAIRSRWLSDACAAWPSRRARQPDPRGVWRTRANHLRAVR